MFGCTSFAWILLFYKYIITCSANKDIFTSSFTNFMGPVYFSCPTDGWITWTQCLKVVHIVGTLFLLHTLAEKPLIICWLLWWYISCICIYLLLCCVVTLLSPLIPVFLSAFHMNRCWVVYISLLYPRDDHMIFLLSSINMRNVFPNVKSLLHFWNEMHLD